MVNDYITVMLANMVAGLVIAALFLTFGLARANIQHWAAALGAVGLVALATGLHMTLTWPIGVKGAQWANIAFGEMTVLLGAVFLAASLSTAMKWDLWPVGVLAAVAGVFAVAVGFMVQQLGLGAKPALAMVGFVTAGIGAILVLPALLWRKNLLVRLAPAAVLLISAAIWTITAVGAYYGHLKNMSQR
jgi:putative membrane protein